MRVSLLSLFVIFFSFISILLVFLLCLLTVFHRVRRIYKHWYRVCFLFCFGKLFCCFFLPWYTVYFERETCRCASNQYRILLFFMPDNIAPLYYSKNQNRQKCFCSFILRHLKSVLSYYYKRWARPNHIEMGRNQATSSTTNQSQIKETTTTTRNWNNFDNFDLYLFIVQLKLLFHWNYERARCALALRSRYAHTHTFTHREIVADCCCWLRVLRIIGGNNISQYVFLFSFGGWQWDWFPFHAFVQPHSNGVPFVFNILVHRRRQQQKSHSEYRAIQHGWALNH